MTAGTIPRLRRRIGPWCRGSRRSRSGSGGRTSGATARAGSRGPGGRGRAAPAGVAAELEDACRLRRAAAALDGRAVGATRDPGDGRCARPRSCRLARRSSRRIGVGLVQLGHLLCRASRRVAVRVVLAARAPDRRRARTSWSRSGRPAGRVGIEGARIGAASVGDRSVVVEPLFDQLLGRDPAGRIEAAVFEELLVLEVDVVLAAAVLLDRWPRPSRGSAAPGTD